MFDVKSYEQKWTIEGILENMVYILQQRIYVSYNYSLQRCDWAENKDPCIRDQG